MVNLIIIFPFNMAIKLEVYAISNHFQTHQFFRFAGFLTETFADLQTRTGGNELDDRQPGSDLERHILCLHGRPLVTKRRRERLTLVAAGVEYHRLFGHKHTNVLIHDMT